MESEVCVLLCVASVARGVTSETRLRRAWRRVLHARCRVTLRRTHRSQFTRPTGDRRSSCSDCYERKERNVWCTYMQHKRVCPGSVHKYVIGTLLGWDRGLFACDLHCASVGDSMWEST